MRFAFRNVQTGKYVSSWDYPHTLVANRDAIGPGEIFEMVEVDVPPPPQHIDPIDGVWPPPAGTPRTRPPDVATVDPTEVRRQLRWALWVTDSDDDEHYWMDAIVIAPEPGHTPGWTNDPYWFEKIAAGNGAGRGYVWPAR